jgi:hypothetical protein
MLNKLKEKYLEFVNNMNEKGIPLPMVRDPKVGKSSITATLVVVSSGLATISILLMIASIFAKLTTQFTLTDATMAQLKEAFWSSLYFLGTSLTAYLGRQYQIKDKSLIIGDNKNENE